jgi:hypothetical protein
MLSFPPIMMKRETFAVADIYVPVKRRATLVQKRVDEIAASMLSRPADTNPGACGWRAFRAWLRAFTGWKPTRRSARKPSSAFAWKRASTERPPGSSGG